MVIAELKGNILKGYIQASRASGLFRKIRWVLMWLSMIINVIRVWNTFSTEARNSFCEVVLLVKIITLGLLYLMAQGEGGILWTLHSVQMWLYIQYIPCQTDDIRIKCCLLEWKYFARFVSYVTGKIKGLVYEVKQDTSGSLKQLTLIRQCIRSIQ